MKLSSRRRMVALGTGIACTGLAGCLSSTSDQFADDEDAHYPLYTKSERNESAVPDPSVFVNVQVPSTVETVLLIDVQRAIDSEVAVAGTDSMLSFDGFDSLPAAVTDAFDRGSPDGLDLARVGTMASVADGPAWASETNAAVLCWADWDTDSFLRQFDADDPRTRSYNTQEIYQLGAADGLVLQTDVFGHDASLVAVGTPRMIDALIDRWGGSGLGLDPEVVESFGTVPTATSSIVVDTRDNQHSPNGIDLSLVDRIVGYVDPLEAADRMAGVTFQTHDGTTIRAAIEREIFPDEKSAMADTIVVEETDGAVTIELEDTRALTPADVNSFLLETVDNIEP